MMKLADARRLALALPEASEHPHHRLTSFRVGGKIFATAKPEGDLLHVFVDADVRERAMALAPMPVDKLLWGGKVVGLRVVLAAAPPPLVRELLERAWRCRAPRHLINQPRGGTA